MRDGTPSDFESINRFDPFGGDRREELGAGRCLVAEADHVLVGYLTYHPAGFIDRPFIQFLAIAPNHRRGGIATSLLSAAQERLSRCRIFISTEEDNHEMLALLRKLDWTDAGCVAGVNQNGSGECFFFRDAG